MAEQQQGQEQVLLKTSFFGGFDKGEVLSCIDRLREQNRMMAAELEEKLEGMAQARGELSSQVDGFEGKISEMEHQLDASADRIRDLTGMVETLKGTVTLQQRETESRERELRTQKEQARQLTLRAQNFEYKARQYEELSTQVGDILLETRKDAGRLLVEAEEEATRIKETAVTASERISEEMCSMRGELVTVRAHIGDLMSSMNRRLDEIDRMILEASPETRELPSEPSPTLAGDPSKGPCPASTFALHHPEKKPCPSEFFRGAANV